MSHAIKAFDEYDRLAFSNSWASDLMAEGHLQLYELEKFIIEKDPKNSKAAKDHVAKAIKLNQILSLTAEVNLKWKKFVNTATDGLHQSIPLIESFEKKIL